MVPFPASDSSISNLLLEEIRQLRAEVSELKRLNAFIPRLERALNAENKIVSPEVAPANKPIKLNCFFERRGDGRKPFTLHVDGALKLSFDMSSVRAAIILVLLLDFQDRCESWPALSNPMQTITRVYSRLESGSAQSNDPNNMIRVALYRFELFCKETGLFDNGDFRISFDPHECRLNRVDAPSSESLVVRISSSDAEICRIIDETLTISPLTRVRRRGATYISAGPFGSHQLYLELLDHQNPVSETSIYYRPALTTFPDSILDRIKDCSRLKIRKQLTLDGFKSGRIKYTEILNRESLWDMIRWTPEGFKYYPQDTRPEEVLEHLGELIEYVQIYPQYELVLTDAAFPFLLSTFELGPANSQEYFTCFYRQFVKDTPQEFSYFVVSGPAIASSVFDKIFSWIVSHPTTSRRREDVLAELQRVKSHLESFGPIQQDFLATV